MGRPFCPAFFIILGKLSDPESGPISEIEVLLLLRFLIRSRNSTIMRICKPRNKTRGGGQCRVGLGGPVRAETGAHLGFPRKRESRANRDQEIRGIVSLPSGDRWAGGEHEARSA